MDPAAEVSGISRMQLIYCVNRDDQNGIHNIELGFLSEGHDSIFSHATSLSEIDIERQVQEAAARAQPVDQR
jgi:hypothetical protein